MLHHTLRLLILGTALACGGCASTLVINAIEPFEMESDHVSRVTDAYRDTEGNVRVCVIGEPATAYVLPREYPDFDQVYSLVYPAARTPELAAGGHESIPQYRITSADVNGGCPPAGPHLTSLPVFHPQMRQFGDMGYHGISDAALVDLFDSNAGLPAIYVFGPEFSGPHRRIVYVPEGPERGLARAVEVATVPREVEGQPAFIMLLPVALAIDIVTSPVQFVLIVGMGHG